MIGRDNAPLDEAGRGAVRALSYGLAALIGACLAAVLLLGPSAIFTPEPLPECAVPVPTTQIKPQEIRV